MSHVNLNESIRVTETNNTGMVVLKWLHGTKIHSLLNFSLLEIETRNLTVQTVIQNSLLDFYIHTGLLQSRKDNGLGQHKNFSMGGFVAFNKKSMAE